MGIPRSEFVMLPLLKCLGTGGAMDMRSVSHYLADSLSLTNEERQKAHFINVVRWAKTNLEWAGLIDGTEENSLRASGKNERNGCFSGILVHFFPTL